MLHWNILSTRCWPNRQFGERWGRHWLDVARYAESTGKEQNLTYPHAWRYRDYVIDSFNEDKPYDRFVQEQIAGDLLPVNTDQQWTEHLVATGFLAIGPKTLTEQNARQFELDLVDEQIDVTTRVMLGVSVACARCHDHKFDPIPQTDYYALSGIFRSTNTFYGTIDTFQNRRPSDLLILPIDDVGPNAKKISTSDLAALTSRLAEKRAEQREAQRQRRMATHGAPGRTPVTSVKWWRASSGCPAKSECWKPKSMLMMTTGIRTRIAWVCNQRTGPSTPDCWNAANLTNQRRKSAVDFPKSFAASQRKSKTDPRVDWSWPVGSAARKTL